MDIHSDEAQHHGYADSQVPENAQGSGWRIFFIVAGSMCGLPVFILATQIFGSLGFRLGLTAVLLGALITGSLGALSAYTWTCNGFVPVTYLIMPPWLRTRAD